MRKEKSPYDKYPLYHYMWEDAFMGNPANLLKISSYARRGMADYRCPISHDTLFGEAINWCSKSNRYQGKKVG